MHNKAEVLRGYIYDICANTAQIILEDNKEDEIILPQNHGYSRFSAIAYKKDEDGIVTLYPVNSTKT